MARRLRFILVWVVWLAAPLCGEQVNEYQMKAAYLYNFAKFVEWPPEAFHNASEPISICVLGQSPILRTLEEAVTGETIEDRKLLVRQVTDVEQASACRIVFIASSGRKHFRSLLRDLRSTGVLTVGETEGFTAEGGVANLKLEGNKVRIEINMNAANLQKLRINPKLLSLAQIVKK